MNPAPSKRRYRWLKWVALVLAGLALYLIEERIRGEWLLSAWKRAARARGLELDYQVLLAQSVGKTQGEGLTLGAASRLLSTFPVTWNQFPPVATPLPDGQVAVAWQREQWMGDDYRLYSWNDFPKSTRIAERALAALREALTNSTWHVVFAEGDLNPWALQPNLARYLQAAIRTAPTLEQRAVYELHTGRRDEALANLHALCKLAQGMANDPVTTSHLVRLGIFSVLCEATWEAWQAEGWSDDQLALLQSDLQRLRFTPAMARALNVRRAASMATFPGGRFYDSSAWLQSGIFFVPILKPNARYNYTRQTRTGNLLLDSLGALAERLRFETWRLVFAPYDQRYYLEASQEVLDLVQSAWTNRQLALVCNLPANGTNLQGGPLASAGIGQDTAVRLRHLVSQHMLLLHWASMCSRAAQADAWNRVVVTAIALKRYRLRHGRWPASLSDLVPEFLEAVPIDPMDARPLRYRLRRDGTFLLYSVGDNGIDDGGKLRDEAGKRSRWWDGVDYVWPRAATRQEVQAWFRRKVRKLRLKTSPGPGPVAPTGSPTNQTQAPSAVGPQTPRTVAPPAVR